MDREKNYYHKKYVRRPEDPDLYEGIRPRFLDFHRMTVNMNYEYPEHTHREYEVIWVEKGPYLCRLNNREIRIDDNRFLIIKPGDTHGDHLQEGQSHFVLHFSLNENLFSPMVSPGQQEGISGLKCAADILVKMESENRISGGTDRFSGALQDSLLETLFWQMIRLLPESALSDTFTQYSLQQKFVSELYRLFSENTSVVLPVDRIADLMRISKRSLSIKCRKYLNDSPARLYLVFRINQAKRLLANSNKTIKEVSMELGFDNPYHFSRAFKRITGKSPSTFARFCQ